MSEPAKTYSALVEGCKRGNAQSQRDLYNKLSQKMFPVCLRYMGDREKAKDVLHDAFITLFTKLDEYRNEGSFEGWARRIFVTTALMQIRKMDILKDAEQIDAAQLSHKDELILKNSETSSMDADRLMQLILAMPEGFRVVFNLYAIEGFSHKEIAKMLGISEGGSRSQLSRARDWLQERLKKWKD